MPIAFEEAVERIRAWGEARDWCGYDPYDGLSAPLAPVLTCGTRRGRRVLTQVIKLSPLNLRPALGIPPARNAKAIALVASGYARIAAATGDAAGRAAAVRWLDWLVENAAADGERLAWGYHFDVQTRFFFYPRGTPNAIATSFAVQALLDGDELLGEPRFGAAARRGAAYFLDELLVDGVDPYFAYVAGERTLVHNANLLVCHALVRTAAAADDSDLQRAAASALPTTLVAQRPDGSWPYAAGDDGSWVDNFHTGYVLEALAACEHLVGDAGERLARGVDFWHRRLFESDRTPRYYAHETYPIDAHCYAQAIETWLALDDRWPLRCAHAETVARLLVERMLAPEGYVYFQQRRHWTSRVAFVRWSTAPAFRALARLLLDRSASSAALDRARLARPR